MSMVRWLNEQNQPSWNDVLLSLDDIKAHPGDRGITLRVGDEDSLIVYFTEYGFLVSGRSLEDADYYVLTDASLGDHRVNVWCAGDFMNRPKKVFVSESAAIQAIKHYFETGKRDSSLNWELDSKCW